MTRTTLNRVVVLGVFASALVIAIDAKAQCCGQSAMTFAQPTAAYYQPATAYYQPTTAYYQPTTTYYRSADSWYPGKWLGQLNRRIWGVEPRYAVAQPATFAPAYTASYAPSYSVGYATTASYAPAVSYSAPAVSYSAPAVSYSAPACTTCAMPVASACDSCCGGATVTQAVYEPSPGCTNCGVAPTTYEAAPATSATPTSPPSTYDPNTPDEAPGLDPSANVPTGREQEAQRPPAATANGATGGVDESSVLEPKADAGSGDTTPPPYEPPPANGATPATGTESNSTYFEAPQLFDPSDRAAQRSAAPVRTAVLHRPAAQATLATTQISWQQAQQDAAGWSSAGE